MPDRSKSSENEWEIKFKEGSIFPPRIGSILNRVISAEGIQKDMEKVRLFAYPSDKKQLQSALGLVAWCRDFVPVTLAPRS
jgi:hypothetical protein